ncbi:MAG: hypothetical protein ACM3JD_11885, partial [Rudaea sp.]
MAVNVHPPGLPLAVHLFRVTVISGMACCVAAAVVLFVQFSLPAWDGGYLVLLTVLLTFETLLSESTVRQRGVPRPARLRVLAAEFGIVLFLLKP